MNVILCGMMGAGKSTVGVKLAQRIGWRFCDTDNLITEKYGEIPSIFQRYGEAHFRRLERETVVEISAQDKLVIATGGGLVIDEENVKNLRKNGQIIYLCASIDTLSKRIKADGSRPLLQSQSESVTDRLTNLIQLRAPIYEKVANYVITVDEKTVDEVVEEIVKMTKIDKIKGACTR